MIRNGKTVILGEQLCFLKETNKKNFKNISIIASLSFFLCYNSDFILLQKEITLVLLRT